MEETINNLNKYISKLESEIKSLREINNNLKLESKVKSVEENEDEITYEGVKYILDIDTKEVYTVGLNLAGTWNTGRIVWQSEYHAEMHESNKKLYLMNNSLVKELEEYKKDLLNYNQGYFNDKERIQELTKEIEQYKIRIKIKDNENKKLEKIVSFYKTKGWWHR